MATRVGLFVVLGLLSFAAFFGLVNYQLYDAEHYGIRVKATLTDVDKISGGYRCEVQIEVTNNNEYDITSIEMNLTILTEDGERFYSNTGSWYILKSGEMWKETFKIDVTEDPGDKVTIILDGSCFLKGELVEFHEEIKADVPW